MKKKIEEWKKLVQTAVDKELIGDETSVEDRVLSFFVKTVLGFNYESIDDICCERKSTNTQGERPDYVLFYGPSNEKRVVIEAKASLKKGKSGSWVRQLKKYFEELNTPVKEPRKIGILTDGIVYEFYSNIHNQTSNMDENPFYVFNVLSDDVNDDIIDLLNLLRRQGKEKFPHNEIEAKAKELNNCRLFGLVFRDMFLSENNKKNSPEVNWPEDLLQAFVKHQIFQDVGMTRISSLGGKENVKSTLARVINDELNRYVSEKIGTRSDEDAVEVYSPEEWHAYYIIMAILSESDDNLNLEDIGMKRGQYLLIYLKDKEEQSRMRTGICRLIFKSKNKIDINFAHDGWGNETIKQLDTLNSLFKYKDNLKKSLKTAQSNLKS